MTRTKRKIFLRDVEVTYEFQRRKGSRLMRLSVDRQGGLSVKVPFWVSTGKAEDFIREKAGWILEKMKLGRERSADPLFRKIEKREYPRVKREALFLVYQKLEKFNKHYGFSWRGVSIRDQKTRWGSCSEKGNLNFNCRIIYLPERWAEYLVVHELCHLKEMNHGPKFWALVGETIPEWRKIKKEIRRV